MNRKLSFIREIIGCLTSPRSSFSSILEKPSLIKATALIFVIAIVAAWASFNYTGKLPLSYLIEQQVGRGFPGQGSPLNAEQLRQAWITMSVVTALIGVLGTWLISSALIHGFSSPHKGNGTFRGMLTLAGYASIPLLIQQLLRLADSFMVGQEKVLQLAASLQISASPLLNTIASAAIDIFTIFRLWSIALLIVAVHENYKISTVRSIIVATLSYIIIAFISVFLPLK